MTARVARPLLVVTPWSPSSRHAGVVWLDPPLRRYPGPTALVACERKGGDDDRDAAHDAPCLALPSPGRGQAARRSLRRLPRLRARLWHRHLTRWSRAAADRAARFAGDAFAAQGAVLGEADARPRLWMLLNQEPATWYLAPRLAAALDAELIATVMDPPESFAALHDFRPHQAAPLLAVFDRAIAASTRLGAASAAMRDHYRARFGKGDAVLIHGLPRAQQIAPRALPSSSDAPFVLAFAGTLYAKAEWRALLDALDACDWRVPLVDGGHRPVRLRVLSAQLEVRGGAHTRIDYLGWRPVDAARAALAEADAAYLPYWLDDPYETSTRLCFPNKLATYVGAGLPVFVHGPAEATPSRFVSTHDCGVVCPTRDASQIIEALGRLADPASHAARAAGIHRAARELSEETFLDACGQLLGVID
ncbi:MAG: glycosyltransferase [Acidobacteriota bacterium]